MKEENYTWYVEVVDPMVNQMVASEISDHENASRNVHNVFDMNDKEKTANLWELPNFQFAKALYKKCNSEKLVANFFVKEGRGGKIRQKAAEFLLRPQQKPPKRYPMSVKRIVGPMDYSP